MIVEIIRPTQKYEPHALRLSETGQCPRYRVQSAMGIPGESKNELAGFAESGNLWHEWTARKLEAAGVTFEREKEVDLDGVKGHIDFLMDNGHLVVDIKTTSQAGLRNAPKNDHVWQVRAYMEALKGEIDGEIMGLLVYIARDNPIEMAEYPVHPAEGASVIMREELQDLKQHVANGTLPDIPEGNSPDQFPCMWKTKKYTVPCSYHEQCWGVSGPFMPDPPSSSSSIKYDKSDVDELGTVNQSIETTRIGLSGLEHNRKELEGRLIDSIGTRLNGDAPIELDGKDFSAKVTTHTRKTLDTQSVKQHLGTSVDSFMAETQISRVTVSKK